MAPTNATRNQVQIRQTKHSRLLRRAKGVTTTSKLGANLVQVSKEILETHPVDEEVPAEEVLSFAKSLLPSYASVFTADLFRDPLFLVVMLKEVLSLYECEVLTSNSFDGLELTDDDRRNCDLVAYLWLGALFNFDQPGMLRIKSSIFTYRGSSASYYSPNPSQAEISYEGPMGDHINNPNTPPAGHQTPTAMNPPTTPGPSPNANTYAAPTESNDARYGVPRPQVINQPQINNNRPLHHPPQPSYVDPSKKATGVQQYFRDDKFKGDLDQSIVNTVRDYEICANQLRFNPRDRAEFFICIFSGPARNFFFENINPRMTYEQMRNVMINEYDSDARRLQVQSELENLRLADLMAEKSITDQSAGLTELVDKINSMVPQCPPEFRSEQNKIRFLRGSVLGMPWASNPIAQITTAKYSFNGFVTALRESLQLMREQVRIKPMPSRAFSNEVLFQRYGRDPRQVRNNRRGGNQNRKERHGMGHSYQNPLDRNGNPLRCYKCGSTTHLKRQCKPGAIRSHCGITVST